MLLQLLHHPVHLGQDNHHHLLHNHHNATTLSLSSSLHCPLIVTSLALQYQERCSGPAATLNSGCRGLKRRVLYCARSVRDSRRSRAENWRTPSHQLLPSPISLSCIQAVAVVRVDGKLFVRPALPGGLVAHCSDSCRQCCPPTLMS